MRQLSDILGRMMACNRAELQAELNALSDREFVKLWDELYKSFDSACVRLEMRLEVELYFELLGTLKRLRKWRNP